jgi:hypothetical protein
LYSSTRVSAATATIGLVIDEMRKDAVPTDRRRFASGEPAGDTDLQPIAGT